MSFPSVALVEPSVQSAGWGQMSAQCLFRAEKVKEDRCAVFTRGVAPQEKFP